MVELAKILTVSARIRGELIKKHGNNSRLLPLQMLTLGDTVSQTMPEFAAYVDKEFESCEVIPTIDGNYKAFREGIYHTPDVELEDFISKINSGSLLNNYIGKETYAALQKNNRKPRCISLLYDELSELASGLSVEENASLIVTLLNVPRWTVRPSVIRLDSGLMANPEETSYVLASKDVSAAIYNGEEALNEKNLAKAESVE